jgi:putative membrane protein (TIGR04086 family)
MKGIQMAFMTAALTVLAGSAWYALDFGSGDISRWVDVGVILSCLAAGYKTGGVSGRWWLGSLAGAVFIALCVAVMTLFWPVTWLGAAQVVLESVGLGALAGVVGMSRASKSRYKFKQPPIFATEWKSSRMHTEKKPEEPAESNASSLWWEEESSSRR